MIYCMSGVVIKMCKFFRYFMEIAALDYLTAQNGKNHQVYDFIQIFSIEVPFFLEGGGLTYTVWPVICYYSLTVWQWCLICPRIRYWETSSMYLYMNLFLHRVVFSILTFLLKVDSSVGILSRKTFSYHF